MRTPRWQRCISCDTDSTVPCFPKKSENPCDQFHAYWYSEELAMSDSIVIDLMLSLHYVIALPYVFFFGCVHYDVTSLTCLHSNCGLANGL